MHYVISGHYDAHILVANNGRGRGVRRQMTNRRNSPTTEDDVPSIWSVAPVATQESVILKKQRKSRKISESTGIGNVAFQQSASEQSSIHQLSESLNIANDNKSSLPASRRASRIIGECNVCHRIFTNTICLCRCLALKMIICLYLTFRSRIGNSEYLSQHIFSIAT